MDDKTPERTLGSMERVLISLVGICFSFVGLFFIVMDLLGRFDGNLGFGTLMFVLSLPIFNIVRTGKCAKLKKVF